MKIGNLIEEVDLDLARKISIQQALKYEVLPLRVEKDKVIILRCTDKDNGIELLSFLFNKKLEYMQVKKEELLNLIEIVLGEVSSNVEEEIIKDAINSKASDIHFEPGMATLNIRFRINGDLILVRKMKLSDYGQITSRLKLKANMDITEKRIPQDGKLILDFEGENYDCRLSTVPVINGEKIVLRILYSDKFSYDLDELTLTSNQRESLRKIISAKTGIAIIAGPTGSGKSTTLYTILNSVKKGQINITTLEDPIEVVIDGINQISLNPKLGITFAKGLRSVLRQDPDIIMLGEIRDEETAKMAIRAAITGHKVYSTIHTKSAMEVYLRLEEMGVQSYLIKDAIIGIISQRLIKTLCDDCKEPSGIEKINGQKVQTYKKCGCISCKQTGYKGRCLVASILNVTTNLREKTNLVRESIEFTNIDMMDSLNLLLKEGKIDCLDYKDFIQGEELYDFCT